MGLSPASVLVNTSGAIQQVAPAQGLTTSFAFTSASNNTLLAANPNRACFSVFNDTNANYLVLLGSTITDAKWSFYLPPQSLYDAPMPAYTGIVQGRGWGVGSGTIYVTELVP